jgi:hypothetical protein
LWGWVQDLRLDGIRGCLIARDVRQFGLLKRRCKWDRYYMSIVSS